MRRIIIFVVGGLAAVVQLSGCATGGATPAEQRREILTMRNNVLAELYRVHPRARGRIARAPGYAVFSNTNVNVILASFAGGRGVVIEKGRRPVYMKMGEAGLGLGLGIKDFRAVFVFRDRATLRKFVNSGWEFGAHADAAAKAGRKGGAVSGEVVIGGITIYQLTQSGLALQATVKGTKYWKDDELN